MLLSFAACVVAATATAAGNDKQPDDTLPVVRYGVLASLPPFQVWPEGGVAGGADLQIVGRLASEARIALELVRYTDYSALEADLRAGRIQLASAMARTPDRETYLLYTPPYAQVPLALVTRADQPSGALLPDLAGRSIAVVPNYASETQVDRLFPRARRVIVKNPRDGVEAVRSGRADTFLEMLPVVVDLIERENAAGLTIARRVEAPSGRLHLAMPRDQEALAGRLAQALVDLPPGQVDGLITAWSARVALPRPQALALSDADRARIAAWPAPVVGIVGQEPPFGYRDANDAATGLSVDMLKSVFARLGIAPRGWVFLSAQEITPALRAGRVDMLIGAEESADRLPVLRFVGPFIEYPSVIVGRPEGGAFDLGQLSGRRLALPPSSVARPLVESRHPRIVVVDCKGIDDCLEMVRTGTADATLSDVVGAAIALARRPEIDLTITGAEPQMRRYHSLALAERHAAMAPLFKSAMDVSIDQDLPGLKARWLTRKARSEVLGDALRRYGPWVLSALLVLTGLVMWHFRRLRAEVVRTQQARAAAERVALEKARFTTFLAHEVRNSLHAVIAGTELVRSRAAGGDAEGVAKGDAEGHARGADMERLVAESARGTLRLLNNLIDRDRLDAGRLVLHPEAAVPASLVQSVIKEMTPAAELYGLTIEFKSRIDGGARLVDALRLQQVVRNLLSNAIKYSAHGGTGGIEIELSAPAAERLLLDVRDRGRGIEPSALARVFEPYRSDSRDESSAGLGLPISRDLARLMGGELMLAAREGGGTVARMSVMAPRALTGAKAVSGGLRVLVVEDAEVFGLVLGRAFEQAGHLPHVAGNIAEAQAALAEARFDLLLTDVNLPDGSGIALLHQVAARPPDERPALAAMTADRDQPLRRHEPLPAGALLLQKTGDARALAERALAVVR